jgi:hypothetical protein
VTVVASLMTRGSAGLKTGGKGSWRRKEKKVKKGGNIEGAKLWQAAQRLGCRTVGALDSASFLFGDREDGLSFSKPELICDMRANTFIIQGNAVKKPMVEIFQDLLSTLDFSKGAAAEEAKPAEEDDLGIPTDVDFDAAATPTEEGQTQE